MKLTKLYFFYSDVKKARLLLKSVRETNPKHPPGKLKPLIFLHATCSCTILKR